MAHFLFLSLAFLLSPVSPASIALEYLPLGVPLAPRRPPPANSSQFNITASMDRARPPTFSNKTGCPLSASPRDTRALRDAAWTLVGAPVQACCDDLDCDTPGTPQHPGDCDKVIKCGAPCPAEPVDGLTPANLNPLGAFDTCKKRAPP